MNFPSVSQVGVGGIDEQHGTESAYVPVVIPARFDGATSVRFHRKFQQHGLLDVMYWRHLTY